MSTFRPEREFTLKAHGISRGVAYVPSCPGGGSMDHGYYAVVTAPVLYSQSTQVLRAWGLLPRQLTQHRRQALSSLVSALSASYSLLNTAIVVANTASAIGPRNSPVTPSA